MAKNTFNSGEFNLYCDVCAKKIKASEAKHRWDGLIVCANDWEPRQPQDFVKAKIDKIMVPFSRPTENTSTDITYGMFDVVRFRERYNIGKFTYLGLHDNFIITDSYIPIIIGKAVVADDTVTFTDTIEYQVTTNLIVFDTIIISESGWLSSKDYVEPDYFLEDYVGLLFIF